MTKIVAYNLSTHIFKHIYLKLCPIIPTIPLWAHRVRYFQIKILNYSPQLHNMKIHKCNLLNE